MPIDIQTPNDTHASAAKICEMAFKAMGLSAERAVDYKDGYDFMVEGKVRVACRYAMPTSDRQQVYTKRNGEVSTYSYKRWTFNFHRHGRIPERYCDYFVCFLVAPEAPGQATTEVSVFVIPWDAITGLTFCSSVREGSSRGYRGKYAVYQDAWHLLEKGARGKNAVVAEQKRLRISADSRRRLRLILSGDGKRPEFTAVIPNITQRRALKLAPAPSPPDRGPSTASSGSSPGSKTRPKRPTAQVYRLRAD
jgi:hypothetical protein